MSAKRKPIRNLYYDAFAEKYEVYNRLPYAPTTADWVQLDVLTTRSGKLSERLTLEVWARGVENYFLSELGSHTLKHLCSDFVTFWRQSLDRYGKPRQAASQVGNGGSTRGWQFQPATAKRFCDEAYRLASRDPRSQELIDELYDEVADMDEVTAFKRLKEIEGQS